MPVSLFLLIRPATLLKKETLTHAFSSVFAKFQRTPFVTQHPWATASGFHDMPFLGLSFFSLRSNKFSIMTDHYDMRLKMKT